MARSKFLKRMRKDFAYYFIRGIIGLFRFFPRKTSLRIGSLLGRIAPFVARKEYRLAVEHLTLAFGAAKNREEIRALARESFRHLALNLVDTVRIPVMTPEEILAICVPHGMEYAFAEKERGHGVISLTSHAGSWEVLGSFLTASGIPLAVIARKVYDSRLEKELYRMRSGAGFRVISRGRDTREIIRSLKEKYFLGVLIDQDTRVKGIFVDFFGAPAHTAVAPAYLSLRYTLPLIPFFTYRDDNDMHHICVGPPITIEETGDNDNDVAALTEKCSLATENFIREHPEQWVWFHRRWKTTPDEM